MSAWSLVAMCHAACQNAAGFLACRALLGFATAGFFPGSLYLSVYPLLSTSSWGSRLTGRLSCWYRPDEITVRMACLSVVSRTSSPTPRGRADPAQLAQFAFIADTILVYAFSTSRPSNRSAELIYRSYDTRAFRLEMVLYRHGHRWNYPLNRLLFLHARLPRFDAVQETYIYTGRRRLYGCSIAPECRGEATSRYLAIGQERCKVASALCV